MTEGEAILWIAICIVSSSAGIFVAILMLRKSMAPEKIILKRIVYTFLITINAIIIILLVMVPILGIPAIIGGDVSNWVTLIVEIGIGTIIALSILFYSNVKTNEMGEILKILRKRTELEVEKEKERLKLYVPKIIAQLKMIEEFYIQLEELMQRNDKKEIISAMESTLKDIENDGLICVPCIFPEKEFRINIFSRNFQKRVNDIVVNIKGDIEEILVKSTEASCEWVIDHLAKTIEENNDPGRKYNQHLESTSEHLSRVQNLITSYQNKI